MSGVEEGHSFGAKESITSFELLSPNRPFFNRNRFNPCMKLSVI